MNGGYFKIKGSKIIKHDFFISNAILIFEKNACLKLSSESWKKINLLINNCIIFSAKIYLTFNVEINISQTIFIGDQGENGIFHLNEINGMLSCFPSACNQPKVFEFYKCKFIDCKEGRNGEVKIATAVRDCEFLNYSKDVAVDEKDDLIDAKAALVQVGKIMAGALWPSAKNTK